MSDIISFGRLLSLCCIVAFYISGWMITVDCLKNYDDFLPARIIAGVLMLHILAIGSVILGVFEYLLASDKADQIKGLLLIILAATIM